MSDGSIVKQEQIAARQVHTIPPVWDEKSGILILGSFPSVKSREQEFFYGHPQNRFWKVVSRVLGVSCPQTVGEKRAMLLSHHIAVWDVIESCTITGSSDQSIRDVVPNDLSRILDQAKIRTIYLNGAKAYALYRRYLEKTLRTRYGSPLCNAVLLPSTSPANAAWREEELAGAWQRILTGLKRRELPGSWYSFDVFVQDSLCGGPYTGDCYAGGTDRHEAVGNTEKAHPVQTKKLYRLSLDGGFTCPNRDGTKGTGGCIFCDGSGSGRFAGLAGRDVRVPASITDQLKAQKKLIAGKLPKTKRIGYIAYFQSFTGTYAAPDVLRKRYLEAAADPEVEVLDIATRPDCLPEEVIQVLREINTRKPVWIELGLQTMHESTAVYIRRGFSTKEYDAAVQRLKRAGISQIITHLILGLPGENMTMMEKSVRHVVEKGTTGIKFSLLHVIAGTDLEKEYRNGVFRLPGLEEYIGILKRLLSLLPPDLVIHRLTGDGDKRTLVAPMWTADKKRVLNMLKEQL